MKNAKIISAYKALATIGEQKLPLSVSHKLWTIKKMLEPHWEFQVEKEQEVIQKYKPVIAPDGAVTFKSDEDAKACREEYEKTVNELADLEVELGDYKKVVLHFDDKIDLSVQDIEAFSDFVEFAE